MDIGMNGAEGKEEGAIRGKRQIEKSDKGQRVNGQRDRGRRNQGKINGQEASEQKGASGNLKEGQTQKWTEGQRTNG